MITFGDVRKYKHILRNYGITIQSLSDTVKTINNPEKYMNTFLWACEVIDNS